MSNTLYHSRAWRHARRRALARDKHRCRAVTDYGGVDHRCNERRNVDVHHITALADGGQPFALENLVTLCDRHHAEISARDVGTVLRRRAARAAAGRGVRQRPNAAAYRPFEEHVA